MVFSPSAALAVPSFTSTAIGWSVYTPGAWRGPGGAPLHAIRVTRIPAFDVIHCRLPNRRRRLRGGERLPVERDGTESAHAQHAAEKRPGHHSPQSKSKQRHVGVAIEFLPAARDRRTGLEEPVEKTIGLAAYTPHKSTLVDMTATMAPSKLPEAEADVLAAIYERGEATARDIREALAPRRPLAHASIATLLGRLAGRG